MDVVVIWRLCRGVFRAARGDAACDDDAGLLARCPRVHHGRLPGAGAGHGEGRRGPRRQGEYRVAVGDEAGSRQGGHFRGDRRKGQRFRLSGRPEQGDLRGGRRRPRAGHGGPGPSERGRRERRHGPRAPRHRRPRRLRRILGRLNRFKRPRNAARRLRGGEGHGKSRWGGAHLRRLQRRGPRLPPGLRLLFRDEVRTPRPRRRRRPGAPPAQHRPLLLLPRLPPHPRLRIRTRGPALRHGSHRKRLLHRHQG
mmetsp:Transcript_16228/g.52815  ORF Transcript_16228/g.52815 Transcript_16228/m.52815 type:complete len:253 (+) Transcript_16228:112-870(+)